MDYDDETLYIHYTFSVSLCRLIDNLLVPSKLTVKAEVDIVDEDRVELALLKINYWLERLVSGCVVLGATNPIGFQMMLDDEAKTPRLRNPLMITPDEPTDDHLCIIFQSKLQALAGQAFAVGTIELTSDNAEGLTFTYVGDGEDMLPTMEEWIDGDTWFDQPWWMRDDGSMFDTMAPEGADLNEIPAWAVDLNFLARADMSNEAIVLKGDFQPRIVTDDETPEK